MLPIEQCRELLSTETTISDEDLETIRGLLYESAQLAFEAYWADSNSGSKNPLGLLRHSGSVDTV
jgi:hypothetical protein